ncbi:MAG: hypothetical protein ACFFCO_06190 [Promethearchaeota archaeon]
MKSKQVIVMSCLILLFFTSTNLPTQRAAANTFPIGLFLKYEREGAYYQFTVLRWAPEINKSILEVSLSIASKGQDGQLSPTFTITIYIEITTWRTVDENGTYTSSEYYKFPLWVDTSDWEHDGYVTLYHTPAWVPHALICKLSADVLENTPAGSYYCWQAIETGYPMKLYFERQLGVFLKHEDPVTTLYGIITGYITREELVQSNLHIFGVLPVEIIYLSIIGITIIALLTICIIIRRKHRKPKNLQEDDQSLPSPQSTA